MSLNNIFVPFSNVQREQLSRFVLLRITYIYIRTIRTGVKINFLFSSDIYWNRIVLDSGTIFSFLLFLLNRKIYIYLTGNRAIVRRTRRYAAVWRFWRARASVVWTIANTIALHYAAIQNAKAIFFKYSIFFSQQLSVRFFSVYKTIRPVHTASRINELYSLQFAGDRFFWFRRSSAARGWFFDFSNVVFKMRLRKTISKKQKKKKIFFSFKTGRTTRSRRNSLSHFE